MNDLPPGREDQSNDHDDPASGVDTIVESVSEPTGRHHRLPYRPALDGIRALAVAAVLAYHADLPWATGGFLGVDAFFVLSGYLITSLLLLEWRSNGSIVLIAFWARRARRLLPAVFLMLIGVAVYAVFFAESLELDRIRGDALATIGYVANWRPVFTGQSYFDRYAVPSPLRHTWSLGIEEQYYVVWPLVLLLLMRVRRVSLTTLLGVTLVMVAASALLMGFLFEPHSDPSRVYYGTDTRAQSLLTGAALAMLLLRVGPIRGDYSRPALQIFGLQCAIGVGILWLTTSEDNAFLYQGGFLFLALAVAVIIAAAVQPNVGPLGKALSFPPLRALGLISYGVYLWHWPVYVILTPARVGLGLYELFALRVVVTLAIATASYYLIEMPIRRGAFRQWKVSWTLAPAGAVCVGVVLVLGTRGAFSPAVALSAEPMPVIDSTADPQPARVMVVGDSMAFSLEPGLKQIAKMSGLVEWNRSGIGCGFIPVDVSYDGEWKLSKKQAERCKEWHAGWQAEVEAFDPEIVVVVFGGLDSLDLLVDGRKLETGTAEWQAYAWGEFEKMANVLTAQGARMVLLTFPCSSPSGWEASADRDELRQDALRRNAALNEIYTSFAELHPDWVTLIDLNGFTCPEGKFTDLIMNGVRMREDGLHFTPESSYIVARWLAPQIAEIAERDRPQDVP